MTDMLRLTPDDGFPEELGTIADLELQVLDSRVQRQLDYEIVAEGETHPETEFRHHELDTEFEARDRR